MRKSAVKLKFDIRQVKSVEKFLEYWARAMADTRWFKEQMLFHYTKKEMVDEIKNEFDQSSNLYLAAESRAEKETLGVLRVKIKENIGTLGRWEPAVPFKHRNTRVGEALIQKAFSWLRENNVHKVKCMLRYPFDKPGTGRWHIILYQKCGFRQKSPRSMMLLADLSKIEIHPSETDNLRFVNRDEVSLEKFADFIMKAYASTAEDRAIHGFDPHVSKREESLKLLQAIKDGRMGFSPPECWKIAFLGDEPAGFVVAFMPRSKYRPAHGVIASIGVFPEFRREGIACALLNEMHQHFKIHRCKYSYVGTPITNNPAIRLYQKLGYKPVFELVSFERTLTLTHDFATR